MNKKYLRRAVSGWEDFGFGNDRTTAHVLQSIKDRDLKGQKLGEIKHYFIIYLVWNCRYVNGSTSNDLPVQERFSCHEWGGRFRYKNVCNSTATAIK